MFKYPRFMLYFLTVALFCALTVRNQTLVGVLSQTPPPPTAERAKATDAWHLALRTRVSHFMLLN